MEIEGVVKVCKDTNQVSDKFKKRELVVTTDETYPQHILVEFQQEKCDLLDKVNVGDKVTIGFNLRGREWEDKKNNQTRYFNTIQGWKIQVIGSAPVAQQAPKSAPVPVEQEDQNVPF